MHLGRKRVLYLQHAIPGANPPLQHNARIRSNYATKPLLLRIVTTGTETVQFPRHKNMNSRQRGNWRGRFARWSGNRIYSILAKFGFVRRHYNQIKAAESLEFILGHLSEFEFVHSLLADPGSRRRFVDVLLLRTLGERHVRLPLDYQRYAACDASIQASIVRKNTVSLAS